MTRPSTSSTLEPRAIARYVSDTLTAYDAVVQPIEAIGFWVAIVMPFVYLPLLASGLDSPSEGIAFAVLVMAHVLALVAGRRHRSES